MDVDGPQTSQERESDADGERVRVGVFDATPDSCVTQTDSRKVEDFLGGEIQEQAQACLNTCISIHMCCQRKVLIRILFSKKGSNGVNLKKCVYRGTGGKHVFMSQTLDYSSTALR